MYGMNDIDQTEFDFSENQETEQERLEREVLAAGGRVGRKEGRFVFDYAEGEGCKRGDEHGEIEGLFFWRKDKSRGSSQWFSQCALAERREINAEYHRGYREENEERLAEYYKGYYEENKERVREMSRRYQEENKEKIAEYKEKNREKESLRRKRYYEANKEKEAECQRGYRKENKEKIAEREKRYREENREKRAETNKKWCRENPEKVRANHARRRAKLREALDPNANKSIIDSRYEAATYLSDVTGVDWHVDHTVPISKGGKHHEDNLQVVPQSWNSGKKNYHNDRWIEDSNIYRYATAVEKRFEEEAKKSEEK